MSYVLFFICFVLHFSFRNDFNTLKNNFWFALLSFSIFFPTVEEFVCVCVCGILIDYISKNINFDMT